MSYKDEWTKDQWKKDGESTQLSLFLDAYETATGERLEVESESERPDFICCRPGGTLVGVELCKITDSPNDAQWRAILEKREWMDPDDVLDGIRHQLGAKEAKRRQNDWQLPDQCILVLELMSSSLVELESALSEESGPDLKEIGFNEVWIADYSELEAYGGVDLFALRHPQLKGHQRLRRDIKPWG